MPSLIEQIAELCHELNRKYCAQLGDHSQPAWADAPDWQRESAINGVQFHMDNPHANPIDSHENWMQEKLANGWVYGEVKDEVAKTHPCIRPYHELPVDQRIKDRLFIGVVRAFS